jgi:hypothetical protein
VWSHRRQSVSRPDAVPSFAGSPFLDPLPDTPTASPSIDGADSNAVLTEQVNGEPVQSLKEYSQLDPCTINNIDDVLRATFSQPFCTVLPSDLNPELSNVLELMRQCLELRDKYIAVSNQRLGDNPRDHDGVFHGIPEGISDVMGVRPEAATGTFESTREQFKPWRIYPPPPPPHWHWTANQVVSSGTTSSHDVFDFSQFDIPGEHEWEFEIDDKGIYQLYHDVNGRPLPFSSLLSCLVVI